MRDPAWRAAARLQSLFPPTLSDQKIMPEKLESLNLVDWDAAHSTVGMRKNRFRTAQEKSSRPGVAASLVDETGQIARLFVRSERCRGVLVRDVRAKLGQVFGNSLLGLGHLPHKDRVPGDVNRWNAVGPAAWAASFDRHAALDHAHELLWTVAGLDDIPFRQGHANGHSGTVIAIRRRNARAGMK